MTWEDGCGASRIIWSGPHIYMFRDIVSRFQSICLQILQSIHWSWTCALIVLMCEVWICKTYQQFCKPVRRLSFLIDQKPRNWNWPGPPCPLRGSDKGNRMAERRVHTTGQRYGDTEDSGEFVFGGVQHPLRHRARDRSAGARSRAHTLGNKEWL